MPVQGDYYFLVCEWNTKVWSVFNLALIILGILQNEISSFSLVLVLAKSFWKSKGLLNEHNWLIL